MKRKIKFDYIPCKKINKCIEKTIDTVYKEEDHCIHFTDYTKINLKQVVNVKINYSNFTEYIVYIIMKGENNIRFSLSCDDVKYIIPIFEYYNIQMYIPNVSELTPSYIF